MLKTSFFYNTDKIKRIVIFKVYKCKIIYFIHFEQDRMSIDAIEEKTQRTQLTVLVLMIFIYLIGADI